MKIKDGYVLNSVAGSDIIVPVCDPTFKKIISLNKTGVFLFNNLAEDTDIETLCKKLTEEYDVDEKTALSDITRFLQLLRQEGLIDE